MTPYESAQANYRAYTLLSRVMLDQFDADIVTRIEQLPQFDALESRSPDDWKAHHYALFNMNVFPIETVFLSVDGVLGGAIADSVVRVYYEAGYQLDNEEPADHIGNELGLMAFLCKAEAQAHQDEVIQAIQHTTQLQRKFLDEHVLRWLPALIISIHRLGDEAFSIMADLMLEQVIQHRESLGEDSAHPTQAFQLPPAPPILDKKNTGFKDIAEFLLTPVYSGLYLGREDIIRLADQCQLPHGFGKRQPMLTTLFETAIEHGAMRDLLQALQDEVKLWIGFYQAHVTDQRFSGVWIARLTATYQFLQTILGALN